MDSISTELNYLTPCWCLRIAGCFACGGVGDPSPPCIKIGYGNPKRLSNSRNPSRKGNRYFGFFHYRFILPDFDLYTIWIIENESLWVCFLCLTWCLWESPLLMRGDSLFSLLHSISWYEYTIIYSVLEEYLDCFSFGLFHIILFWTSLHIFLVHILMELLGDRLCVYSVL